MIEVNFLIEDYIGQTRVFYWTYITIRSREMRNHNVCLSFNECSTFKWLMVCYEKNRFFEFKSARYWIEIENSNELRILFFFFNPKTFKTVRFAEKVLKVILEPRLLQATFLTVSIARFSSRLCSSTSVRKVEIGNVQNIEKAFCSLSMLSLVTSISI